MFHKRGTQFASVTVVANTVVPRFVGRVSLFGSMSFSGVDRVQRVPQFFFCRQQDCRKQACCPIKSPRLSRESRDRPYSRCDAPQLLLYRERRRKLLFPTTPHVYPLFLMFGFSLFVVVCFLSMATLSACSIPLFLMMVFCILFFLPCFGQVPLGREAGHHHPERGGRLQLRSRGRLDGQGKVTRWSG